ncbi:MAG: HAMP domain-containing histidine kinase, partial [Ruminococcus sp.]|nr:HAMP domain-containing histidine kinase [Ruminococcus sp.]
VNASTTDGKVIVTVADTGCGIKESDLSKVKTKFYKANHTRRGSGIGLAVADEIIAMHEGTMEISSAGEGKGTTVTIVLPAKT